MGQSPSSDTYNSKRDGLPFYQGVTDFGEWFPTARMYCSKPTRIAQKGDILFSVRAPIGRINIANETCATGRGVAIIRAKKESDQVFLRLAIESISWYWDSLEGSGAIFSNAKKDDILNAYIPWSDSLFRKNTSKQISSLDSYTLVNNSLESLFRKYISALFRSWFIDFDPVKLKSEGKLPYGMDEEIAAMFPNSFEDSELGLIPAGWKVKPLFEVSNLYDNLRIPLSSMERKKRKGKYPYHGATSVMDYIDDFIYDGVYLLIAEDGSVLNKMGYPVMQYVWGKFWVNNHAHVLQGKNDITTEHLLQYMKNFYIQPFVTGAVQLKINQKALSNVKLIIAPRNINNAFNNIVQSLYRSIRDNKMKSKNLALTRDALLPRLMSGELEVN
jgi:type I restriction enzyme, S subunit